MDAPPGAFPPSGDAPLPLLQAAPAAAPADWQSDPDPDFRAACHALFKPKGESRWNAGTLLVVSLIVYVAFGRGQQPLRQFGLLVGVLIFHELGHWIGMRLFGYRDVKVFFIPFFGALMTGEPRRVRGWQSAVVLLLGPLPGILLGFTIIFFTPHWQGQTPLYAELTLMLLLLNGFNLLPLGELDGGQLFNLLIFSRHPVTEVLFRLCGSVGLILLALKVGKMLLLVFAGLGLLAIPIGYRIKQAVRALHRTHADFPEELTDAPPALLRELYTHARGLLRQSASPRPEAVADHMRTLHQGTLQRPVSGLAALALLAVYGVTLLLALASLLVLYVRTTHAQEATNPELAPPPAASAPAVPAAQSP